VGMKHVYKPAMVLAGILVFGVIFFVWMGIFAINGGIHDHEKFTVFMSLPMFGLAIWIFVGLTERVTLTDDAIERSTILGTSRLNRSEIAGWQVIVVYGKNSVSYALNILPKNPDQQKPVYISGMIKVDAFFKTWITAFPNLSQNRFDRKIEKLLAQSAAAKVEEVRKKYQRLKDNPPWLPSSDIASPQELADKYFGQWSL
jgi:hypothetical protein